MFLALLLNHASSDVIVRHEPNVNDDDLLPPRPAGLRVVYVSSPEAPFEGEYEAIVTIVDRVVDAASGTFAVRLELPNENGRLPAGLKCSVSFPSQTKP